MPVIKAVKIHAPAVRVGSRLVKTFHAALLAEQMLGRASTKPVGSERIRALLQYKILMRNNQVNKPGAAAHRTIAFEQFDHLRADKTESHRTAMAAAGNIRHLFLLLQLHHHKSRNHQCHTKDNEPGQSSFDRFHQCHSFSRESNLGLRDRPRNLSFSRLTAAVLGEVARPVRYAIIAPAPHFPPAHPLHKH